MENKQRANAAADQVADNQLRRGGTAHALEMLQHAALRQLSNLRKVVRRKN